MAFELDEDAIAYLTDKEFEAYCKVLRVEAASKDFRSFIEYTMPNYQFNWHHEAIISRLNKLVHQKNQRLLITVPPRHGKSELASRRFPAFLLGINPNARIIACSYSAGLATTFNRDVQRILESESFAEVFPDTMIPGTELAKAHPDNKKYKKQASFFEIIDHSGFLLSTGVEGSITGLGADLLLIDDPIKNEEEASSETIRDSVFAWYNSTAYTRLEGGANIMLILTRWHKGDLAGRLLEEAKVGGEKWEVLNFPAISTSSVAPPDPRKEGEALWPGKYDIERLEIIKRQVGTRVWSSLYQQNPTVEGGNIVKEEWFQYYHKLPFDLNNWREAYLVNSWDVSFKKTGKSYNVGVVIAKHKADFYLIDMWRQRAGIVEVKNAVKKLYEKYPSCKTVLIEGKANGPAIIQLLKKQVSNLVEVNPGTSKDERLEAIAPIIEAGNFYLPHNSPISKLVVEEMTSFPNADNDDIVDAISQGLIRFMEMRGIRHLQAITKWTFLGSLLPFYCYLWASIVGGSYNGVV